VQQSGPGCTALATAGARISSQISCTVRFCSPPQKQEVRDRRIQRTTASVVLTTIVNTRGRSWTPRCPSRSCGLLMRPPVDSRGPGHSPERRKVGGSTPPVTTSSDEPKTPRRIPPTEAFDGNRRTSDWYRSPVSVLSAPEDSGFRPVVTRSVASTRPSPPAGVLPRHLAAHRSASRRSPRWRARPRPGLPRRSRLAARRR